MSEENRKYTTEDNTSKDGFFKRNKNKILYGVAIMLPCLSIIVLIAGSPTTWFKEDPAKAYSKNVASKASNNTSTSSTSTSSTSTSSGSSNASSSSTSTSGTKKSTVNVNGASSKSNNSTKSNSSSTSKSSSSSKSSGSNKSYGSSSSKSSNSSKSKSNARKAAENYDAGYNAIYEDDDYSQSRYNRDKDYAMGVDDAIDDLDWE